MYYWMILTIAYQIVTWVSSIIHTEVDWNSFIMLLTVFVLFLFFSTCFFFFYFFVCAYMCVCVCVSSRVIAWIAAILIVKKERSDWQLQEVRRSSPLYDQGANKHLWRIGLLSVRKCTAILVRPGNRGNKGKWRSREDKRKKGSFKSQTAGWACWENDGLGFRFRE